MKEQKIKDTVKSDQLHEVPKGFVLRDGSKIQKRCSREKDTFVNFRSEVLSVKDLAFLSPIALRIIFLR